MTRDRPRRLGRHLRHRLLTGRIVLLPLIITLGLLSALFSLVDGTITPWVRKILLLTGVPLFSRPGFFSYLAPVIGLVITALLIYLAGLLGTEGVKLVVSGGFLVPDRLESPAGVSPGPAPPVPR